MGMRAYLFLEPNWHAVAHDVSKAFHTMFIEEDLQMITFDRMSSSDALQTLTTKHETPPIAGRESNVNSSVALLHSSGDDAWNIQRSERGARALESVDAQVNEVKHEINKDWRKVVRGSI